MKLGHSCRSWVNHVVPRGRHGGQSSSWPKRVTNSAFELSISLESLSVGEREDLHHDHAGDPHRGVDPVICIEQAGPCQAAPLAAVGDGIDIDHASKPPPHPNPSHKTPLIQYPQVRPP